MKRILSIIVLFITVVVNAQDIQISQYYASPLFLNPAMTGLGNDSRAGVDYRNQWSRVGRAFSSEILFADHHFSDYNISVGGMVMNQSEGSGKLRTTEISGLGAYTIHFGKEYAINAGLQATYGFRGIDYDLLDFGDQYDNTGIINDATTESFGVGVQRTSYTDISSGFLFYGGNLFAGLSMHHIIRPDISLSGLKDKLDRKISFQAGYRVSLESKKAVPNMLQKNDDGEKSLIFVTNYKQQGIYTQYDIGAYMIYEPIMFGLWYRGLPVGGKVEPNESIVLLVGTKVKDFKFGYSYDYALNSLRGNGIAVHEISLTYEWIMYQRSKLQIRRGPKEKRKLPCSKFLM